MLHNSRGQLVQHNLPLCLLQHLITGEKQTKDRAACNRSSRGRRGGSNAIFLPRCQPGWQFNYANLPKYSYYIKNKKTHRKSKNIVENVCSKPWKSMGKLRQARIFRISGKREKIFPEYKKQYQHKWKLAVAVCLCVRERENVYLNVCVWEHKN